MVCQTPCLTGQDLYCLAGANQLWSPDIEVFIESFWYFAVHAAVIAINEAIDRGVPTETFTALKNPNAMLVNLNEPLSTVYQNTLSQAKQHKTENARKRVSQYLYESCQPLNFYHPNLAEVCRTVPTFSLLSGSTLGHIDRQDFWVFIGCLNFFI